jgi:hypothetical protein
MQSTIDVYVVVIVRVVMKIAFLEEVGVATIVR